MFSRNSQQEANSHRDAEEVAASLSAAQPLSNKEAHSCQAAVFTRDHDVCLTFWSAGLFHTSKRCGDFNVSAQKHCIMGINQSTNQSTCRSSHTNIHRKELKTSLQSSSVLCSLTSWTDVTLSPVAIKFIQQWRRRERLNRQKPSGGSSDHHKRDNSKTSGGEQQRVSLSFLMKQLFISSFRKHTHRHT